MLTLPTNLDLSHVTIDDNVRRVVIIGANGAGKSLFTSRLCHDNATCWRLNVLEALYHTGAPDPGDIIDARVLNSTMPEFNRTLVQTRLERLLGLLLHDELIDLLADKIARRQATDSIPRRSPSHLDRVIDLWQGMFPQSHVLVDSGRFLFRGPGSNERYGAPLLSDGEKAVLFYACALCYAPKGANIVVDSPEMFLHPSTIQALWNRLETMRHDCRFIYVTHDLEFAASRQGSTIVWVEAYNPDKESWKYSLLGPDSVLSEGIYMSIIGARRPVLFVEGDATRSIDAKLYPLLFPDMTVKSLGSCNRVIEATRTFNALNDFHHLTAMGIVDRDRRNENEVAYLRSRQIMVPKVAEIENIFMLPRVIAAVAAAARRDPARAVSRVKNAVITMFDHDLKAQALEHTRHHVKRTVEYRVDGRFNSIAQFEQHIARLTIELNPRSVYENTCRAFRRLVADRDYMAILKVYNHKSMLSASNVAAHVGLSNKDAYIERVLKLLAGNSPQSAEIRAAALAVLTVKNDKDKTA